MKTPFSFLLLLMLVFTLSACKNSDNESKTADTSVTTQISRVEQSGESSINDSEENINISNAETVQNETEEKKEVKLNVQIGGTTFYATLEKNSAVDAFVEMMQQEPVVINMSDYSKFEKVGSLGQSLPSSNSQITTQSGDIVLYNGNQIVIFYGSNSWSYTRIGKIDDLSGWAEVLGTGDVTVTFSIGDLSS